MGRKKKTEEACELNKQIAEQLREEQKQREEEKLYVPLDEEKLTDIGYARAELAVVVRQELFSIEEMAKNAMGLDDYEAKYLQVYRHVRDIKNSATEIVNYLHIIRLLLEHMSENLNEINTVRAEYRASKARAIQALKEAAEKTEEPEETPEEQKPVVFQNDSALELLKTNN